MPSEASRPLFYTPILSFAVYNLIVNRLWRPGIGSFACSVQGTTWGRLAGRSRESERRRSGPRPDSNAGTNSAPSARAESASGTFAFARACPRADPITGAGASLCGPELEA